MILYRARHLVSMDRPPIEDGGLLIDGGKIAGVGRYTDLAARHSGTREDLGEVILMPGLINAHCHLELSSLRHLVLAQSTFAKWIERINSAKRMLTNDDYLAATAVGTAELLRHGTTSVVNIESFPEIVERQPNLALRTWWCYEMLDLRLRHHSDESMRGALRFFEPADSDLQHFGLSPHAPYSTSAPLFRLASAAAKETDLLLTTHVAESTEEMQMLRDASGPLYEFLKNLGRDMSDCGHSTPLAHLIQHGNLQPEHLLVHLNELSPSDYTLLARWARGQRFHVVHCPKSCQFFQHSPFPYDQLLDANANISLGTDSLASNDRLDLFSEMRCFAVAHPEVAPIEIVEMVTRNPALALQQSARLGLLREGACADAITISTGDIHPAEIFDTILENKKTIPWMMIAGQVVGS